MGWIEADSGAGKAYPLAVHLVLIHRRTCGMYGGMTKERRITGRPAKQLRMWMWTASWVKASSFQVALRGTNEKIDSGWPSLGKDCLNQI